jgi:hypothetical protein
MCTAITRMFMPPKPKIPAAAMAQAQAPPPEPEPTPQIPTQMEPGSDSAEASTPPSESPAARQAAEAQRLLAQRQRGRAATVLTGSQGLVGTEMIARPAATKMLLGG